MIPSSTELLLFLQSYIQAQTFEFVHQYVERFWQTRLWHRLTFYDGLIGLGPSDNIIRFNGQYFPQGGRSTIRLERPNLHFTETLTTELCFTAQGLLRDQ